MLDYQRIVDDVRSSMFSNSIEGVDFLRSAAADYAVACDEVNERLRKCGGLLRQGLRSEAIQLAEIEPILLDVVAMLDFPERRQWEDVVIHYGIVAPAPLMFDVAADLNEAYAIEQPLTELLKQHRLLALAHGPLKNRIGTLRSLVQADDHNPIWREDLQSFETERLKQLQHEVADAAQAGDLMTLAGLDDELRGGGWSMMPPASLLRWTAGARQKLEDRDARVNLERIADGLREAHAAFEVDFGRQWREHWNAAVKSIVWSEDDPVYQTAGSALDWLAEQDEIAARQNEHDAAVAKLETALRAKSKSTSNEVIRLHNAAVAHGFQLADYLEEKYRNRLDELARAVKRRRIATISSISAAIALAIIATWFIWKESSFSREVKRQNEAIATLLSSGNLAGAQKKLDQLNSESRDVAESDEIQARATELKKLLQQEEDHRQAFDGFLHVAEANGPAHPDYDALREATKLAQNDAEKTLVEQFKNKMAAADRDAAAKRDSEYLAALAPFRVRVKELKDQVSANDKKSQAAVDQFQAELKSLDERSRTTADARSQGDAIRADLNELQALLKLRREEDAVLGEITAAVGDIDNFKRALTRFVQQFPDEPRWANFKRALDDAPLWTGVAKWNELLTAFVQTDVRRLNPADAKEFAAKVKEVTDKYGEFPDIAAVRQRLAYVESIKQRVDSEQQRIDEPLKRLFADALVSDIWLVETNDGRRFYLKDDPNLAPSGLTAILYFTGFDLATKKRGVDPTKVTFNDLAPQVKLAHAVRPLLNGLSDENWEHTFYHIVKEIDESKKIDPILEVNLLKQTIEIGSRGSSVFERAFAKHLDALKEQNINPFANWLDPFDKDAPADRHRAELALTAFPDIAAAGKAAAAELEKLRQPPGTIRHWIGWLRHGPGDNWRCEPTTLGDLAGELFVVVRRGAKDGMAFDPIGGLKDGIATISIPAGGAPPEGSPVYLVAPPARAAK